ncbi:MAG: hypothetical protein ACYCQI_13925 [Gammaproteobacteria bacterium]
MQRVLLGTISEIKEEKSFVIIDEDKTKIINNLTALNLSDTSIQRIMAAVDKMPDKYHVKGVLKFLTEITAQKSKREDYYQYSNFISEYFCTISNLGLFAVGYYYSDFATLLAATFSALSHAIPLQRLHDFDLLGVGIIFAKVMANYKIAMERPEVLGWGACALTVNVLDMIVTRKHLDKIGPSLHVAWHLAAAFALYQFNKAQTGIDSEEVQAVLKALVATVVPNFLYGAYKTISGLIQGSSSRSDNKPQKILTLTQTLSRCEI